MSTVNQVKSLLASSQPLYILSQWKLGGGKVYAPISSRRLGNLRLSLALLTLNLSNHFLSTFPSEREVGNTLRKYRSISCHVWCLWHDPFDPNIPIIPPHKSRVKLRPEVVAPFLSFPSAPVRWTRNVTCNVTASPPVYLVKFIGRLLVSSLHWNVPSWPKSEAPIQNLENPIIWRIWRILSVTHRLSFRVRMLSKCPPSICSQYFSASVQLRPAHGRGINL